MIPILIFAATQACMPDQYGRMHCAYVEQPESRACSQKLIASIHRCEATGCDVLLPDGTKGKTTKWPVEFAKVQEVCQ